MKEIASIKINNTLIKVKSSEVSEVVIQGEKTLVLSLVVQAFPFA